MSAPVRRWVPGPVGAEVEAALGRLAAAEDVAHVAVMPDVHLCDEVCIGTVLGTRRLLYPAAVGGDLGCGVATMRCRGDAGALADGAVAGRVLRGLARAVPIHRRPGRAALPDGLDPDALSLPGLAKLARREGAVQLGTLGRGNHFLELQADAEGALWIMAHTGSRAVGPAIRDAHAQRGRELGGFRVLEADGPEGRAYLADLAWAVEYAQHGRLAILAAAAAVVREVLGVEPEPDTCADCAHNFVRREAHAQGELLVHRKGAISAREGEPGLVPGSMGAPTFHVLGRGCADALCSSSHGAGRAMSRTEARRAISPSELRRQLGGVHVHPRSEAALVEEAPRAYKDIGAVMRAQRELTRIVREVRPVLSHKG